MALELPASLSPSKVSSFTDCALAFRFSTIDRLPEPPSAPATKGTLVHAALERLFVPARRRADAPGRPDRASTRRWTPCAPTPTSPASSSTPTPRPRFLDDAERLVRRYFELEDPQHHHPDRHRAQARGPDRRRSALRGIIDRLELDDDGGLVVTDYKTGRVPRENNEQGKLGGVHFYAFLCEQLFGQRPARVQLLYLDEPVAIITTPTEQSIRGLERKVTAMWTAVERACATEDFRPEALEAVRLVRLPGLLPGVRRRPGRRQGVPSSIS